jgi:hypothetical protein
MIQGLGFNSVKSIESAWTIYILQSVLSNLHMYTLYTEPSERPRVYIFPTVWANSLESMYLYLGIGTLNFELPIGPLNSTRKKGCTF